MNRIREVVSSTGRWNTLCSHVLLLSAWSLDYTGTSMAVHMDTLPDIAKALRGSELFPGLYHQCRFFQQLDWDKSQRRLGWRHPSSSDVQWQ